MNNHRFILSLVVALGCIISLYSQTGKTNPKNYSSLTRDSIEAILVRLAFKNNPTGKIAIYQSQVAERAFRQEQRWFLETVRLSGNLNEFSMSPDRYVRSQFFPRYNFSMALSLGDLINRPAMVRTRRIESEISKLQAESERQNLKTEVLKRYNHYVLVRDRLTIQNKLESEIAVNLELARSKFNKGTDTYEAFSALMEKYYNLQITVKEMEESLHEARLNLEALIGVSLETVITD